MRPLLLLPLTLLLAACGSREIKPPEAYDVSGTISGDWGEKPQLRLALVGFGLPDAFKNDSRYEQTVVPQTDGGWRFGLNLPPVPDVLGVYQVVVFADRDGDARLDPEELRDTARNRQWLLFSPATFVTDPVKLPASDYLPDWDGEVLPALKVQRGWNLYNRARPTDDTNPSPAGKVTGYDLSR